MEALRAGALAVLEKPAGMTHADYEAISERRARNLCNLGFGVCPGVPYVRNQSIERPVLNLSGHG